MIAALLVSAACASPLVTGNGFGYAVVEADSGVVSKLFAHPYRFMRKREDSVDGVPTSSLVRRAYWSKIGAGAAAYVRESHVIEVRGAGGTARFVMPFELQRNVLVTATSGGTLNVAWVYPVKTKRVAWGATVYAFAEVPEQVAMVTMPGGAALIVLASESDAEGALRDFATWRGKRTPAQLIDAELGAMEAWRVPAKVTDPTTLALWRQSETILRMAQIREPNRDGRCGYGLINASLPDGGWFIPWVRDGAYAIVGLTHMGHTAEARLALEAWLNATPMSRMLPDVRNAPYQISTVRYFGDGSEDADTSGQPFQNVEFDSWGLALWAIADYVTQTGDRAWLDAPAARGSVYVTARDFIVAPLLANTDSYRGGLIMARDSSVWEQNNMPRQHYACSTIAAIHGLRRFAAVARLHDDTATADMLGGKLVALTRGFDAAYARDGRVVGTLEDSPKNAMDGCLLDGILFEVITDPKLVQSTLERLEILKTNSGGYRRVTGPTEYEKHEFVLTDFALARVYVKLGKPALGDAMVQTIALRALADHGFVPEMIVSQVNDVYKGPIGAPAGAVPMVGYGAGVFMLYLSERPSR